MAKRVKKRSGSGKGGFFDLVKKSKQNFIDNLDFWLVVRQMSQADLARAAGITAAQISRWRTSDRLPRIDKLDRIADALMIPVHLLLFDPTDPLAAADQYLNVAENVALPGDAAERAAKARNDIGWLNVFENPKEQPKSGRMKRGDPKAPPSNEAWARIQELRAKQKRDS